MKTPDITPVQSLAVGLMTLLQTTFVALSAFGIHITSAQVGAIEGVFAAFLALVVYLDVNLRKHRISNLPDIVQSKVLAAQSAAPVEEPAPPVPETTADELAADPLTEAAIAEASKPAPKATKAKASSAKSSSAKTKTKASS